MTPPLPLPSRSFLRLDELVNFQMKNNPTFPMIAYADDQTSNHHITEITFLEFGRAAHRVAHALSSNPGVNDGQVIMLIANCDALLYDAVVVGIVIAGLVPFLVSHRNTAAAVVDMMKKTHCSRIVTMHHAHNTLIEDIRKEIPGQELVVEELPALSYVFPSLGKEVEEDPFVPHPGPASRADLDSPGVYFHSSGSTGFPKPIAHTHRILAFWSNQPLVKDMHRLCAFTRMGVMTLPPFHGYGLTVQVLLPLHCFVTACLYAPRAVTDPHIPPVIPTSDNMLDCARWAGCSALMTVPTFLEQLALSRERVEQLKMLKLVLFGGGPLTEKIGDELCAAGVAISSLYGGTEFGCPILIRERTDIEDGDWNWMRFSDEVDVRWAPYGNDTYECQVLYSEDHPLAVENMSDARGYATSDLFIKHPTKNLWKIVGRADDVIILASGEKTVVAPMEDIINSSPLVQGSVMFGRERNQVGILIEPNYVVDVGDDGAVAEFRNKIWSLVDEANKAAPAFSRIFKEMILVAKPEKPFLRTPKGSIRKKLTIKAYEAEIDALYAMEAVSQDGVTGPSGWTADVLNGWLLEQANAISDGHGIDPTTDLFTQGFDSLSATNLRNRIITALGASPNSKSHYASPHLSQNIVFENPTVELLAARVESLVNGNKSSQQHDITQHVAAINAMMKKYSNGLPIGDIHHNRITISQAVVLLTGSTGGLGSFMLARLIESPVVTRIYAFNRPSSTSSVERQTSAFTDKGLSLDLLKSDKLVYVEADASQDRCGLLPSQYNEICGTVTTVIHNAWRLDFNLSLASFEPNVKATRNLVDLALNSYQSSSLRFVFTSSIGSVHSWESSKGACPEEIQLDPSIAVGSGYGEAKHVCERIIANSGLHATSLRIGQIAGGPNGSWATTDWVPIIVKSSIALGVLPNSDGVISWMRAEDVAESVLDVAFAPPDDFRPMLNIINPQRPSWTKIMSFIREAVLKRTSASLPLELVSFTEWVNCLEKRAESATQQDLDDIPAIKLLEFFRGMASNDALTQTRTQLKGQLEVREAGGVAELSIARAQRVSKTVAHMSPIGEREAYAWVNYWCSVGFL